LFVELEAAMSIEMAMEPGVLLRFMLHHGKADHGYQVAILVLSVVERVGYGFDESRRRLEVFQLAKL
jgi:hypothetical protein